MVADVESLHRLQSLLLELMEHIVMPGGARGAEGSADG